MDFTNEISSFWYTLFLPIVLGILMIILMLWPLGKGICCKLCERFLKDNNPKYVLRNGVYIPRSITQSELIKRKIISLTGVKNIPPAILIFVLMLLLYGIYKIVILCFQPMLTHNCNVLFACGVGDNVLASIWSSQSNLKNINELYVFIMKDNNISTVPSALYTIESYCQLYICILIIVFLISMRWKSKKEKKVTRKRVMKIVLIVCLVLCAVYFMQIQYTNQRVRSQCYTIYNMVTETTNDIDINEIGQYEISVATERERLIDIPYYGAYSFRICYLFKDLYNSLLRCLKI